MAIIVPFALILTIMSLIILNGKGDSLIAGYNTASKQEQNKYNIKKLRQVVFCILNLLSITLIIFTLIFSNSDETQMILSIIALCLSIIVISIIGIIFANKYAKNK